MAFGSNRLLQNVPVEPPPTTGLSTGLRSLDDLLGGLHPGHLTVIAARPGMGRKQIAVQIALTNALEQDVPTVLMTDWRPMRLDHTLSANSGQFTTTRDTLASRVWLVARTAGLDPWRLHDGRIGEQEQVRAADVQRRLRRSPFRLVQFGELGAFCSLPPGRFGRLLVALVAAEREVPSMGATAQALRGLAVRHSVPAVLVTGINRGTLEDRQNKRPTLADIADLNVVSYAAQILFLYRDAVYFQDSPCVLDRGLDVVRLTLARNEAGPLGSADLLFDTTGPAPRFRDPTIARCI